ncbi:hypothetical protein CO670_19210 [Rhizobium sp. J15]|uniref:YegJ family protein n=1 Tax=Rhizobium sp. J15 TaxID=2035450 RepID=UPI000BEA6344|nr:DUF2314 domain-containing protein [Rhizobium sp. J15]PDT15153.1 hypothetical protein CO670_19210 [Rhizobium sp. J15]
MLRGVISILSILGLFTLVIPIDLALANDNIQWIKSDDPAMAKAHEKSKSELDGFLEKLRNPPPGTENYNIKLGFTDKAEGVALVTEQMASDAEVEYMWVYQIEASGDHFTALLGDTPEYLHNIKQEDRVEFEKSDIFDWMYIENGKVKGNYTACPLLLAGPKEQLEQYREVYGIVCD